MVLTVLSTLNNVAEKIGVLVIWIFIIPSYLKLIFFPLVNCMKQREFQNDARLLSNEAVDKSLLIEAIHVRFRVLDDATLKG